MTTISGKNVSVLQKINHHTSDVTSCDFWSNQYLATGSGDKTVMVWEWQGCGMGFVETSYSPLLAHKYSVTCVRFSPKGSYFISSSVDGYTVLWNVKSGESVHSFVQSNGNGVRTCCFSLDASLLATGGEGGTLCLWSLNNYSLAKTIQGHDDESIQGVSFSPDDIIMVSGDVTGSYKVWAVASSRNDADSFLTTVRDAHDLGINALEFSSQYTVFTDEEGLTGRCYLAVTCGNDHSAILWQISLRHSVKSAELPVVSTPSVLTTLQGHTSAISSVRFSLAGDLLASTSIDKTVRIWQVSNGKCVKTLEGHSRYVACCAFSSNQALLATGSNDKSVWVWDLTGEIDLGSQLDTTCSALNSKTVYTGSVQNDDSIVKLRQRLYLSGAVNTCHFSDTLFATGGSDKRIELWNWTGDELVLVRVLEGHTYCINQVEFSPDDSLLASSSHDGTAVIWDSRSGEVLRSGFQMSGSGVRCVRWSPNSRLVATGTDDETASIFTTDNCQLLTRLSGHSEAVTCVSFSPDSSHVMTGSTDGHCRLYRTTADVCLYTLEDAHDLGISSSDFSPVLHAQPSGGEGKYELATCGHDCLVKVWKVDAIQYSITLQWRLAGHGGSVTCVRYSPQLAELIASTATDKTCRLWDSYSGECLHVLNNHEGILTCCAFSPDTTLIATGSMDKTIQIWELPKDLTFQSFVAGRIKESKNKDVLKWNVDDVNTWLQQNNLPPANLTGASLLDSSLTDILDQLNIEGDVRNEMGARLGALRRVDSSVETPHELICPITHQIMRDPVICTDGYSYERCAIESWFNSGHLTSPMTNAYVTSTNLEPNIKLRQTISTYLSSLTTS